VLASLNHPHIGAIYGLEEAKGCQFLVLELVSGETLAQRIAGRPLPIDEALAIARQVADALEAAHEKGIIHRDLKPANIALDHDGQVKVLDFGLAKATGVASGPSVDLANSPTLTSPAMMTGVGVILGTAAYMSPEQAKGRAADKRSDVWAFGCVLYEMLTGKRAFAGDDVSDTLASVLAREPDLMALPPAVPASIRRLMRRCLNKDRTQRIADISTALFVINEPAPDDPAVTSAARRAERRAWIAALVSVTLIAMATTIAWVRERTKSAPPAPETRLDIATPSTTEPSSFAISPDGRRIVFVAAGDGPSRLWLRALDVAKAQPLAGTDGASYPFWSPDSRSVGFFVPGKLQRLDIGGGLPQPLAKAPRGISGAWNPEGVMLFAPATEGPLFRLPASGGEAVAVTTLGPGQTRHQSPQFLPGGRHFLFYAVGRERSGEIYVGSLDAPDTIRVTAADSPGLYAVPGWLLFVRQGSLVARRFDAARGVLTGDPVSLADGVGVDGLTVGAFSVSAAGVVMYRAGGAAQTQLTWFDRSGKALGTVGAPDENRLLDPALSPDGHRVAVSRNVERNIDIWLLDEARTTRFTFDTSIELFPLWSPDGRRIVFSSSRTGGGDLYQKPSSGAGREELLLESPQGKAASSWSPDGRFLLYRTGDPKTGFDLWVLPMEGTRQPFPFLNASFNEGVGQFSPDGRWVAYQSDETGRYEIDVRPFPGPGGQWQISTAGGISPRWRPDGQELDYIAPDGTLMAAPIVIKGAALEHGLPTALFRPRISGGGTSPTTWRQQYAVAPDGRFLINVTTTDASPTPITVIQNWAGALKP
jgi:Tol biopolymer transport system component